jgi:hypothetical protein
MLITPIKNTLVFFTTFGSLVFFEPEVVAPNRKSPGDYYRYKIRILYQVFFTQRLDYNKTSLKNT